MQCSRISSKTAPAEDRKTADFPIRPIAQIPSVR